MKTKLQFLRWLMMLMLLVCALGTWAQVGTLTQTGAQTVCITGVPEPYGVINTTGSTYSWQVVGGTSPTDWVLASTTANTATVLWKTAGNYTVQVFETNALNCLVGSPVTVAVTVSPLPTATIGAVPATVCQNGTAPVVTFTGADGTAPYTFTYTINGGVAQTVTTTSGNSVTVTAPTAASGVFTYALVSVQDASPKACTNAQTGTTIVTVNPLPTATIGAVPAAVCQNGTAPVVTFTGTGGTAPYTFTYTINGGSAQTVTTTSGNSVTVTATTAASGVFTYALVSVQDASGTACTNAQTGTTVVTVNSLPNPTITGTTPVCETTSGVVYKTETGMSNYVWTISGGGTITGGGTTDTVTVTWNTAGAQTITVNYQNANGCTAGTATSKTVIVDALPATSPIYHN